MAWWFTVTLSMPSLKVEVTDGKTSLALHACRWERHGQVESRSEFEFTLCLKKYTFGHFFWNTVSFYCLQCFDAVSWAAGRASSLQKTEWWGADRRGANLHMVSWCHCHSLSLASVKSRLILVSAHPDNPGQSLEGCKADLCVCVCVCVFCFVLFPAQWSIEHSIKVICNACSVVHKAWICLIILW